MTDTPTAPEAPKKAPAIQLSTVCTAEVREAMQAIADAGDRPLGREVHRAVLAHIAANTAPVDDSADALIGGDA